MTVQTWQDAQPASNGMVRWAALLAPAVELATAIADTDFVPAALRGNPGAIAACIMYGDELGIGPLQALQSVPVIDGKPSPSAELARALILRDGHSFVIHEATGTRCVVSGLRKGRPESERTRVEWALDMARSAGLLNKAVWQRYPRAMLVARATTELGRQVFPDVVKGLGDVPEDLTTVATTGGWQPDADSAIPEPPKKRVTRRRTQKQVEAPPVAPPEDPRAPTPDDVPLPGVPEPPADAARPPVAPAPSQWPPLPPEPPQAPRAQPMKEGLRKAYMAGWKEAGIDADTDRMLRLAVTSVIIGRTIETSSQMTQQEGLKVVGVLADVENGALAIVADQDGAPKVISLGEPPGEVEDPPDDTPPADAD